MWNLKLVKQIPLSGKTVCSLAPTTDGGIAVGYREEGVEIVGVDGRKSSVLVNHHISGVATLSDGRFVVRSGQNDIDLYGSDWERVDVEFDKLGWVFSEGGLAVDHNNHIFVVCQAVEAIRVYRLRGGGPYRQILCRGLAISDLQVMRNGNVLVVTSPEYSVKVLEEVDGEAEIKHEVNREDARPYPALLADNTVLIGWAKDGEVTFELYTDRLERIGTVLSGFRIQGKEPGRLRSVSTNKGEVVFATQNHLNIFSRT